MSRWNTPLASKYPRPALAWVFLPFSPRDGKRGDRAVPTTFPRISVAVYNETNRRRLAAGASAGTRERDVERHARSNRRPIRSPVASPRVDLGQILLQFRDLLLHPKYCILKRSDVRRLRLGVRLKIRDVILRRGFRPWRHGKNIS